MKALIIGAAGFVGNHLIDHLLELSEWSIYATKMSKQVTQSKKIEVMDLDILDMAQIEKILSEIRPEYIFHLAAQSSVALSWKNPSITVDVNIKGCLNVLGAVKNLDYQPRILLIGSGEEYGRIKPQETPISEKNNLRPGNIYAATKVAQNMIGKIYADAYNMDIVMVRAFNHIGPGQSEVFVVSDFCKQVAEIEKGIKEPVLNVGNLNAERDFTDVRDVVRAYVLLMKKGIKGQTYNIGSGEAVSINKILDMIVRISTSEIVVNIDQTKLRPLDVPIVVADIEKVKNLTGWERKIKLEDTIEEVLDYWRSRL